ncbi:MAG: DUF167 domain-containing protein [Acidobacteriota bacterium]
MIVEKQGFIQITIRVVPRAARSEIVGEHDGMLKVRIASPPVDGAANAEVVKLLAKKFGVPKGAVAIVSGQTSKTKQIRIAGVTAAAARKLLGV